MSPTREHAKSRAAAFGISGAVWIGAAWASDPSMIHYPMPNAISLAIPYVLIGTTVIAWSEEFVAALLGLWILAMVFFAVLLFEPNYMDWTLFLGSSIFGTIAFLMWLVVAFLILTAARFLRSHLRED